MRILVMSDTHMYLSNAIFAIEQEVKNGLDVVIHCGDKIDDARKLEKKFVDLKFYYVPGNCDSFEVGERDKVLELANHKIFITHGDYHNIKRDYEDLLIDVKAHSATIGICGHSHCVYIEKNEGILIINPGSITLPRDSQFPSYAIIEIFQENKKEILEEGGKKQVDFRIMMIKDKKIMPHFMW